MDTIERGFLWVLLVIGLAFFGTAFFMKSRLDVAMRIVFGGVIAIFALSEIYPGFVMKIFRKLASMWTYQEKEEAQQKGGNQ